MNNSSPWLFVAMGGVVGLFLFIVGGFNFNLIFLAIALVILWVIVNVFS